MITGTDIENSIEAIGEAFPKKRDGWDSADILLEVEGARNGKIYFFQDVARNFSASVPEMSDFGDDGWRMRFVEALGIMDQTMCVGRMLCPNQLNDIDAALLDSWLASMMEISAEANMEISDFLLAAREQYLNNGIMPDSLEEKWRFATEFLDIERNMSEAGRDLFGEGYGSERFFCHGFRIGQDSPDGEMVVERIWSDSRVSLDEVVASRTVSENEFKNNIGALLDDSPVSTPAPGM